MRRPGALRCLLALPQGGSPAPSFPLRPPRPGLVTIKPCGRCCMKGERGDEELPRSQGRAAGSGEQPESRAPLTPRPRVCPPPPAPGLGLGAAERRPRTHAALCEVAGAPPRPTGRSRARIPSLRFSPPICNRLNEVRIKIRFHGENGGRDLETDTDRL